MELPGVDLSQNISDDVLKEIRAALHENLVVFFRKQTLTLSRQLAFDRRWGVIHLHPFVEGTADYPAGTPLMHRIIVRGDVPV